MDTDMDDVQGSPVAAAADPACSLWIRRQVFEHSVAVPLLTKSAAEQIDFSRLAASMAAASVTMDPDEPPAITYQSWIEIAAKHTHLDPNDDAGIIIEALETNAPNAFVRCNELEKLAAGRQVDYRQLLIPVPELIAFMRLHAAATLAARFRETADAVWPSASASELYVSPSASPLGATSGSATSNFAGVQVPSSGSSSPAPASSPSHSPSRRHHQQQLFQQQQQQQQQQPHHQLQHHHSQLMGSDVTPGNSSPTRTPVLSPPRMSATPIPALASPSFLALRSHAMSPQHPPGSPVHGLDGMVRKKTQPHSPANAMLNSSSAIVASVTHSLQRETHLVASSMTALLTSIAATYGILPSPDTVSSSPDGTGLIGSNGSLKDLANSSSQGVLARADRSSPSNANYKKVENVEKQFGAVEAASGSPRSAHSSKHGTIEHASTQGANRSLFVSSSGGPGSVASDASTTRTTGASGLLITRNLFEHLSFLLTTTYSEGGKRRSISCVVPEWRDPSYIEPVPLGRLVEITTAALTRILADPGCGPVDTAEIRDLERKTIIRTQLPETNCDKTDFPHGREVRITNCSESFIYLLCSLGRVSFIGCRECTLFVGSCVSLSVIGCDRVRVHVIARICRLTNCFDTDVYLCTNRRPQIVGDNRRILFAPYNVAYPFARRDLAAVGVDATRNSWNQFYRPSGRSDSSPAATSASGSTSTTDSSDLAAGTVGVLPPQRFLPFAIPAVMDVEDSSSHDANASSARSGILEHDSTSLRPLFELELPLPPEYQASIVDRKRQVESFLNQIHKLDLEKADVAMSDSALNVDQTSSMKSTSAGTPATVSSSQGFRALTQTCVRERFHEWLASSGHMRQINDLTRLEAEGFSDSSNGTGSKS